MQTYVRGAALHPSHQSLISPDQNFPAVQINDVTAFEDEQESGRLLLLEEKERRLRGLYQERS
jgi:hypothetical protein